MGDDYSEAVLWTGGIVRCQSTSPAGAQCDLLVCHSGPHFYVLDHDDDGDPKVIATWNEPPPDARGGASDG